MYEVLNQLGHWRVEVEVAIDDEPVVGGTALFRRASPPGKGIGVQVQRGGSAEGRSLGRFGIRLRGMKRAKDLLSITFTGIAAALTFLGVLEKARNLPDDLAKAVQVPCNDSLTDGSEEPPDQDGATRNRRGRATPLEGVGSFGEPTGWVIPAKTA